MEWLRKLFRRKPRPLTEYEIASLLLQKAQCELLTGLIRIEGEFARNVQRHDARDAIESFYAHGRRIAERAPNAHKAITR